MQPDAARVWRDKTLEKSRGGQLGDGEEEAWGIRWPVATVTTSPASAVIKPERLILLHHSSSVDSEMENQ